MLTAAYSCAFCHGRGWLQDGQDWPRACEHCHGYGSFTRARLAAVLGEDTRTLERVEKLRVRSATAHRVFRRLVSFFVLEGAQ